jgi:hypothetical protein
MRLSKTTILLGEPVWVDVRITNRSDDVLRIEAGNHCIGKELLLKVQVPPAEPGSGERVSCRLYGGYGGSCPLLRSRWSPPDRR